MSSAPLVSNVLVGGSVALAVVVAVLAWRNRPKPGATMLAGFMLAMVTWHGMHLLAHFVTGPAEAVERLRWLGAGSGAFWWLLFVLSYTGREHLLDRRTIALVLTWPALFNVAIWLPAVAEGVGIDAFAGLWAGVEAETSGLFWGHVLLSYGILAVGTVFLLQHSYRANALFRRQGLAIQSSLALVWVASVVSVFELFGSVHLHALPVGFLLSGVPLLWAIVRSDLSAVTPIARATVFDTIDAAVVVVDSDGTVVDVNDVANQLLDIGDDEVGSDYRSAFDSLPELDSPEKLLTDGGGDAHRQTIDDAVVQLDVSPVTARDDTTLGHVIIGYDVTQQHEREAELRRQNERLDAFASVVSHDLRSPLHVACGKLELAAEECRSSHHDDVEAALDRMDDMIDDVLTLAREGKVVGDTEPVSLDRIVEQTWESIHTEDATLETKGDLPTIETDPDRFPNLLSNLFGNCVEHGGEAVTVRVGDLDDGFFVVDDGPGIPADRRDDVFERGYSTTADGTGFGLAIVAQIADAHGWTVELTESEQGGARFEVTGITIR